MAPPNCLLVVLILVRDLRVLSDDVTLEPEVSCNKPMIPEGESLSCECRVKMNSPGTLVPNPPPLLSWPGHSNTSVLTADSVQREDNGTVFTCLMEGQGMENKTATHTLLVAFGPSQDKLKIKCNKSPFVTDGSRTMALSCEASDVYPTPFFGWGGLCESNKPNCTCQPQPDQDGRTVRCTVTNAVTIQSETSSYTVRLEYPPMEAPVIVANTVRAVLSAGDILTCTVRGGKPLVASVNFHCTNPFLPDRPDLAGENSVSSSVIVDTTDSRETPAVCHCSSGWEPEPDLYQKNNSKEFQLEFKASVTNFTVNETTKLTVTEDDEPDVVFYCDVATRPTANVSLLHGNKTQLAFSNTTNGMGSDHYRAMHKLSSVRCEDTGVFVCEADNGLSTPSNKSVHLDVLGRPRLYTITNNSDQTPELTEKGIVITLVTNPVPYAFHCAYLSLETGELQTCHPDIKFKSGCKQHTSMTFLATCSVHPVNVPENYLGFYSLSISNGLGNYTLSFEVRPAVTQPALSKDEPHLVAVFVVIWILLMIAVIVITIYIAQKRKQREPSDKPTKHDKAIQDALTLPDVFLASASVEEEGFNQEEITRTTCNIGERQSPSLQFINGAFAAHETATCEAAEKPALPLSDGSPFTSLLEEEGLNHSKKILTTPAGSEPKQQFSSGSFRENAEPAEIPTNREHTALSLFDSSASSPDEEGEYDQSQKTTTTSDAGEPEPLAKQSNSGPPDQAAQPSEEPLKCEEAKDLQLSDDSSAGCSNEEEGVNELQINATTPNDSSTEPRCVNLISAPPNKEAGPPGKDSAC